MRNTILFLLLMPFFGFAQDFSTYEWEIHNMENTPFPENLIADIFFQDNGIAWVTTSYQELYSYDGTTWTHHPKPEEWTNEPQNEDESIRKNELQQKNEMHGWLKEITITKEGKLWISGIVGFLISYEPTTKKWEKIPFPSGQPWVIRQNKKGVVLIATSIGAGKLYQFHKGKFTLIEDQYQDAFEILFDDNGDAYVGFRKGCYLYKMNEDGTYTNKNKTFQSEEAFYDMEFDSKGKLWASSYSSMYIFSKENGRWKKLTGAPEKIYFDYNGDWKYIPHKIAILPDDRLVFSTQFNASIAIYGNGIWEAYNLPVSTEDGVGSMKIKDDLSIWCGTWKHGVQIFKPTGLSQPPIDIPATVAGMKYIPLNDGEKTSFTPDDSRKVKTSATHTTTSSTIQLEITDYDKVDGDIISLYFNGGLIVDKKTLSQEPTSVKIQLQQGNNELLLFAHNLGSIPPNTAAIHIIEEKKKTKLDIDSDYNFNGRILLRKVE